MKYSARRRSVSVHPLALLMAIATLLGMGRRHFTANAEIAGKDARNAVEELDLIEARKDLVLWHERIGAFTGCLALTDKTLLVGATQGDSHVPGSTHSVLLAFSADNGRQVWQVSHQQLSERVHDLTESPIASQPFFDADRAYYISNRGELCCIDISTGKFFWKLDMIGELGVFKRDPNDIGVLMPSPIVIGDMVFCVTGNGGNFTDHGWQVPNPKAPSFLAVGKRSGKVLWSNGAPGKDIIYGQWSTPAVACFNGKTEILFAGGDGYLYSFDPPSGKQFWKFDCRDPRHKESPDFIVAPILVNGETAYVSTARDIEQTGAAPHHLLAIDLRTHEPRWEYSPPDFHGTLGPMRLSEGKLIVAEFSGLVVAVDAAAGREIWRCDLQADNYGGVVISGNTVYVAKLEGLCAIALGTGRIERRYNFGSPQGPMQSSPGRLFVTTVDSIWCIQVDGR